MTTAASVPVKAGAPGFEPGIAGPKPAALPLGYAPPFVCVARSLAGVQSSADGGRGGKAATALMVGVASDALPLGYAPPFVCVARSLAGVQSSADGGRGGKAATDLMVGVASDALALGYAPVNVSAFEGLRTGTRARRPR